MNDNTKLDTISKLSKKDMKSLRGGGGCSCPGGYKKTEVFIDSDSGGDTILRCIRGGTSVNCRQR